MDPSDAPLPAPAPDRDDVFARIQACIAESLAVDASRVRLESRLLGDLAAGSLDFLEMIFAFEAEFSITLQDGPLDRLLRTDYEEGDLTADGCLPDADLAALERWLPALREAEDRRHIAPRQLFDFITVESLVMVVEKQLALAADGPA